MVSIWLKFVKVLKKRLENLDLNFKGNNSRKRIKWWLTSLHPIILLLTPNFYDAELLNVQNFKTCVLSGFLINSLVKRCQSLIFTTKPYIN